MKLLSKGPWASIPRRPDSWRKRSLRYRATFWDSEAKRYFERECDDTLYDRDGHFAFLNTSSNVSYFSALLKAAK